MRTIHRYILIDYLISFLLTLSVFTFVMCLGVVIKAIEAAARTGVSPALIANLFLLNVPYMLTMTIPISALTACLLLFGRLSFDGELTAMRASGLSLWGIISPIVIAGVTLSVLCVYINIDLAPRCKYASREVMKRIGMERPINILEPGRFIQDFPNMQIYVGSRSGNEVEDVVVYESDTNGPISRINAEKGSLRVDEESKELIVGLFNARGEKRKEPFFASYVEYKIGLSSFSDKPRQKKPKDMMLSELINNIRNVKVAYPGFTPADLALEKNRMILEVNKRFALSLACFAFTLIGIPLGMKSRRKESSVGIGIALGLVCVFYLFIIAADALVKYPAWQPDMIVWIPVILCEVIGFYLIYKQN